MITYEQRLSQNRLWAFQEGSLHFENASVEFIETIERATMKKRSRES